MVSKLRTWWLPQARSKHLAHLNCYRQRKKEVMAVDKVLLLLHKTTYTTYNDAAFQNYNVTLTNYIQQSSALQVTLIITRILWNPKFHHCVPTARHLFLYSARQHQSMHFNIIVPSTPRSPKQPLSFKLPYRNSTCNCHNIKQNNGMTNAAGF